MKEIYVSVNNNGKRNGTKEYPFNSLYEAKECAELFDDDVIITLRGGRYFFDKSLRFDKENKNIIYIKSYNDEKVYFDGGIIIDNRLIKKISDKEIKDRIIDKNAVELIYEIDMSPYKIDWADYGTRGFRRAYVPSGNELYVNSVPYNVSRYPKEGEDEITLTEVLESGSNPFKEDYSMHPFVIKCDYDRCVLWEKADDFYISGIFTWAYADDTQKVAKLDVKNKTITSTLPHLPSMKAMPYSRWHALNLLEELSGENEYYIDKRKNKIYFIPQKSVDVKTAVFQLSVLDTPLIVLKNVKNIIFDGITIENTRGTGLYMDFSENCVFKNGVIRNTGMLAVQIGKGATALPEGRHNAHGQRACDVPTPKSESEIMGSWHEMLYQYAAWDNDGGKNNGIVNCEIYNTATGGIMLGGGNRKTLESAGNYVDNCHIYSVNRLDKTYKGGINIMGVGNRITHCKIHDMPGFAIYLHGNDHKIHYNEIYDAVKEASDAGAIYMGRDASEVGNEFCYNYIHDITGSKIKCFGICAIYFDDGACFNLVKGNYFYNVKQNNSMHPWGAMGTIFWGWGSQTSVCDNIFIDCPHALNSSHHTVERYRGDNLLKKTSVQRKRLFTQDENNIEGVDVTSEIWRTKYPYLYDLFIGRLREASTVYNNLFPISYHWFEDYEKGNFKVKSEYEQDFENNLVKYVYDPIRKIDSEEEPVNFKITDFNEIGYKK